jgi:hypothetical protein
MMSKTRFTLVFSVFALLVLFVLPGTRELHAQRNGTAAADPLVERIADTGFIQLYAESVRQLDPGHQALAYWLSQASIAIDPIIYDQLSRFGIRQKRMLKRSARFGTSRSCSGQTAATTTTRPRRSSFHGFRSRS